MEVTKTYTLAQLIELANTGTCAVATEQTNGSVCADKTEAAFFDPSRLKTLACKTLRFKVQNQNAEDLFLGFGAGFYQPGEDPLYPKSEFFGNRGVDNADFFVGDANIPVASGPNALAVQSFLRRCPRTILSSISIVNAPVADAILNNEVIIEKFNCGTGKCDNSTQSPKCPSCPTGQNSTTSTVDYDLGLVASDERDAVGLSIPGSEVPAEAPVYTIDVKVAFHEGAYGYVAGC